jgi:amino acid transporter
MRARNVDDISEWKHARVPSLALAKEPPMSSTAPTSGVEQFGYSQELRRRLSYSDLIVYGLVFMVPIAPFAIFGSVYQTSGGMPPLAYVVGMLAMMCTASSYAQMAQAFPMAGSVYTYVGRGATRPLGFVAGWMILLDYVLIPCLLYLAAGMAMAGMVPGVPVWVWVVGFIVLNTGINYLGITLTALTNKVMLAAELVVLAIFLVVGVVAVAQGKGNGFSLEAFFNPETFTPSVVLAAVSIAVLSFLGFDGISTLAEEHTGTTKQLGRSMFLALLVVGLVFIAQTWVASMLVPDPAGLVADGDPDGVAFYEAAEVAGGHWLYVLTAAATAVAWGFANALVAQAATSRLLFAMARDRQLPAFLKRVHPRHGVPVNATFLVAGISLVLGIWLTYLPDGLATISTLVNFGALSAFLMLNATVVWFFVVKQRSRRWGVHVALPVVGFLVIAAVMLNARPYAQVIGLVWLAVGVVLAVALRRRGRIDLPEEPAGTLPAATDGADDAKETVR